MQDLASASVATERFSTTLLGSFAVLGLILAAGGLYGLISFSVAQRRQEIAIRTALGADRGEILWILFRQSLWLTALGIIVGTVASALATRLLAGLIYDVSRTDPVTILGVTGVLMGVASIATYLPARRAMRLDVMPTLRGA